MASSSVQDGEPSLEQRANVLQTRSVSLGHRMRRLVGVATHYRLEQICRRGVKVLRQRLAPNSVIGNRRSSSSVSFREPTEHQRLVAELAVADYLHHVSHAQSDLERGDLCLLCESRSLGRPINWKAWSSEEPPSHLWRFHLQYHEFLLSYVADCTEREIDPWPLVAEILHGWIDQHPPETVLCSDDAWHPYCISRRLAVWTWLVTLAPQQVTLGERLAQSYWAQAEYLSENLELDLGGNHLLENLSALSIAGSALHSSESETWIQLATRYLRPELSRQVLSYGEHFERSPIYHCQVVAVLLRIMLLSTDDDTSKLCRPAVEKMSVFLSHMKMGDGEVPLFADSVWGESPSVAQIEQLADLAGVNAQPANGNLRQIGNYAVFTDAERSFSLVVDGGDVGATDLPAHAHCDLMNLELTIGKTRWITDSGNFDYEDSPMRRFCRSSMAHTVVTIDSANHCDIWSKFRMVYQPRVLHFSTGAASSGFKWCVGRYRLRLSGSRPILTRAVILSPDGDLVVADLCMDNLQSQLVGFIQIGPEIQVTKDRDNALSFALSDQSVNRQIIISQCENAVMQEGWQCPAFGKRVSRPVVEYSANNSFSCWQLVCPGRRYEVRQQDESLRITAERQEIVLPLA